MEEKGGLKVVSHSFIKHLCSVIWQVLCQMIHIKKKKKNPDRMSAFKTNILMRKIHNQTCLANFDEC